MSFQSLNILTLGVIAHLSGILNILTLGVIAHLSGMIIC